MKIFTFGAIIGLLVGINSLGAGELIIVKFIKGIPVYIM
jgi:hypothetical protein